MPSIAKDETPSIQWRKGDLIGSGAFGRVYMGMNTESGELIAVKEVQFFQFFNFSFFGFVLFWVLILVEFLFFDLVFNLSIWLVLV